MQQLILLFFFVFNSLAMSAQHLSPLVLNSESLRVHLGESAYLVGTYKELDVAKKSTVTRYVGRAYLELLGGGAVVLETDEKGIRTPEEIEKYRNKTVVIYGFTRSGQTVWGGGQVASLVMTSLSFSTIDLVDSNDFAVNFDSTAKLPSLYLKEDIKSEYIGQWVQIEGELTTAKVSAKILDQQEKEELKRLGSDTSLFMDMRKMMREVEEMNKLFKLKSYDLATAVELGNHGIIKLKDSQPSELLDSNNIGSKVSLIGRLQGVPPYGCYLTELQKVAQIDTSILPIIKTKKDIDRYDGEQVIVIGEYTEIDVAQHPKRTVYIGRAALSLADGSSIALEVDDEGIRAKRELKTCKKKRVKVIATLHSSRQLWGKANEAAIVSPCLTDIQSVEIIK